jgi:hypothetical protein
MKVAIIGNPTIGADIEVFLIDRSINEIVSAEPYIKGTKHEPFNFDDANKYFAISLDNVLAEFCIPPANHVDDWVKNIQKSLDYIKGTIPSTLDVEIRPSAILDSKYLQTLNAQTFGCEPDLNVWLRDYNPKPDAPNKNLRSAGGHIHIGYDNPDVPINEMIIKTMDLMIGVPSVIQEPDNERKLLYGKAGCARFKPYGVEYRTVSNYYLSNEKLTRWAYERTKAAIDFINNGRFELVEDASEMIQTCINTSDKTMAMNLINQFDLVLV